MNRFLTLRDPALLGTIAAGAMPIPSTGLLFWGKGDGLAGADGAAIASWTDLSGNGNHATESTNKPAKKTAIVNGHDIIRFGVAPSSLSSKLTFPNIWGAATTGEAFLVCASNADPSASGAQSIWHMAKTTAVNDEVHPYTDGQMQSHFGADVVTGLFPKPTGKAATTFHVYNVHVASNKLVMRWDGEIYGGWDKITPGFANPTRVGNSPDGLRFWRGDMAELILYSRVLSDAERLQVTNYLAARYAITTIDPGTAYTPSSFSGLQGWWRTDSLALNDADPVASWADISGNSRTLTQATASLKPIFKTNIQNGRSIVRYDGVDDSLLLPSALTYAGTLTFAIVAKSGTNNSAPFGNSGGQSQMRIRRSGVNEMNFFANNTGEILSGTAAWQYPLGDWKLYVWKRTAGSKLIFMQNAVEISQPATTQSQTFTLDRVGGTAGLALGADVGEVAIWNTDVPIADISKLYYSYFRDRWGLP